MRRSSRETGLQQQYLSAYSTLSSLCALTADVISRCDRSLTHSDKICHVRDSAQQYVDMVTKIEREAAEAVKQL
jgi:hypothetical protein